MLQIRKAERRKSKLRLGICGAAGSGKTWSALEIAKGMGGKIGLIDTESGRGELYGDNFDYDIIRLDAPFSPDRYIQAIKAFENGGYEICIVDSLSHAWVGDGGVLSIVEKAGSNSFTQGWKIGTPKQNSLVEAIISSSMHIIATMRVKSEYVVEKNEKGKVEPRKIGLSPIQRDGLEYEFTVFMDINQEHIAHITKDNTNMFDQQYIRPSIEMGQSLIQWLNHGADEIKVEKKSQPTSAVDLLKEKLKVTHPFEGIENPTPQEQLFIKIKELEVKPDTVKIWLNDARVSKVSELGNEKCQELIDYLNKDYGDK